MSGPGQRDFESSSLGTIEHWDSTYEKELEAFKDIGDVGEIWFGEDSQERILDWIEDNEEIKSDDSIIDLGCGNGMLLVELSQRGYSNLTGMDYSAGGIELAKSIAQTNNVENIKYEVADLICDDANKKYTCLGHTYKVCVDKGTYDAISLMPSDEIPARQSYLQTLKRLMTSESLFIITSCNWTQDQLVEFFGSDLHLHDKIKTPSFQFGGKTGNTVTSLIFKLKS
ncbi:EEF1A lysine methyltransferase 2-like [Mytilus trossulus]|uniref:EEF1A lysine methyltransferase 2-like n=1 Tax=Mytilus trossulus TaxID=6551 RepID=UPI0030049945